MELMTFVFRIKWQWFHTRDNIQNFHVVWNEIIIEKHHMLRGQKGFKLLSYKCTKLIMFITIVIKISLHAVGQNLAKSNESKLK